MRDFRLMRSQVQRGLCWAMTDSEMLEVERKYDVGEDDELPVLESLPGVDRVESPEEEALDAVYFDTAGPGTGVPRDHAAPADRRTRRRMAPETPRGGWGTSGIHACGWAKNPESVPRRLRQLVQVHTRDQDVIPVARLKTRRTTQRLFASDGTALADFSDDRVDSQTLLEPQAHTAWREWEIELIDGPRRLLKDADALLAATGHHPSALPSKLARGLGGQYPAGRQTGTWPGARGTGVGGAPFLPGQAGRGPQKA